MSNENKMLKSFSGANTCKGFVSFYDRIFQEDKFAGIYIIKGGSGTGKSTFMRRLGDIAINNGYICYGFLCGSDETSLDGLIIEGKNSVRVGILDGTPPHARELRSPGAAGDILNFGAFWNSQGLREKRHEIDRIVKGKNASFETAYRYLGAAEKISKHIENMSRSVYLKNKGYAAAVRIADAIGKSGNCEYIQLSGYTMNGTVRLLPDIDNTIEYKVVGNSDIGALFLNDMADYVKKKGIHARISLSPLDLSTVEGIFFPESGVLVSTGGDTDTKAEKVINIRRFTDKDLYAVIRQKFRFGKKCREALLDGARESLDNARELHFKLEDIYKEYMDFDALNRQSEIWYSEILSRLD